MLKTVSKSRQILNKLIFDPDGITWSKPTSLVKFSEQKVLDIYYKTLKDTGYANYDEMIIRVIGYNDTLINSALIAMTEEMPDIKDEVLCDHTKWYDDIEKNEVAFRMESISSYVCKVLDKYGITYVPFMEHMFEKPILNAFGINGILTVNDCQNSFVVYNDTKVMSGVGLNAVRNTQCNLVRSSTNEKQVMIGGKK